MRREEFLRTTSASVLSALIPGALEKAISHLSNSSTLTKGFDAVYDLEARTTGTTGFFYRALRGQLQREAILSLRHDDKRYELRLEAGLRREITVQGTISYNSPLELQPTNMRITRKGQPRAQLYINDEEAVYNDEEQQQITKLQATTPYDPLTGLLLLYSNQEPVTIINREPRGLEEMKLTTNQAPADELQEHQTNGLWNFTDNIKTSPEATTYQGLRIPYRLELASYQHPRMRAENLTAKLRSFKTYD